MVPKFLDRLRYSNASSAFASKRYTKFHILGALKMMGCKHIHAVAITGVSVGIFYCLGFLLDLN